jgi:hypothetical protein
MDFQQSQKYLENLSKVLKNIREETEAISKAPVVISIIMIIILTFTASSSSLFNGIEGLLFSGCIFCAIILGAFLGKKMTLLHIVKKLDEVENGEDETKTN